MRTDIISTKRRLVKSSNMQPSSFGCLESFSSERREGSSVDAGHIVNKTRDIHLAPFRNSDKSSYRSRSQTRAYHPLWCLAAISVLIICFSNFAEGLKCLDCVGKDCMGSFCTGDYCVLSHYAPRWGTVEWFVLRYRIFVFETANHDVPKV